MFSAFWLFAFIGLFAFGGAGMVQAATPAKRTNFLVVLVRDLGFSDAGCYGGEMETPYMDYLASKGLRFTQAYHAAGKGFTEASLLTGYYPQHLYGESGVPAPGAEQAGAESGAGSGNAAFPVWAQMLPVSLKAVGYRCYHAGVWSAGGSARDSGFDRSCTVRGKEVVVSDDEAPGNAAEHKPEDAIAEGLCGFLKGHAQQTAAKPFFALVNLGDGMEGTQDDRGRERYAGRFDGGREALEKSRIERLWEMGMLLNTEFSPLLPAVEQGGAVQGRGVQHADFQRRMETQSARVERMDQQLGRVLEQIKTMGAWDQTLVLVLSERGHHASSVPLHTPLRESGCGLHEAGIATPMIVHWPAGFRARGEAREHFVHAVDVAPTLLKVANVTWPKKAGEIAVPTADGVDILPVLRENKAPAARPLWWSCAGSRAYRLGDWKWISPKGKPVELYYLKQDRSELRDLADANFERVKEMELQWTRMADRFLGDWKDKSSAQGQ